MDISRDLGKRRKKSESGSEKLSRANTAPETVEVNGKTYQMPDDLKGLPEFDWDDPINKKWAQIEQERFIKKYGRLTSEQFESMYHRRLELEKQHPGKSVEELNMMALAEIDFFGDQA